MAPKYDMRLNPVYQVDYHSEASGKRLSATKRRVRWSFGFSNAQAIREGQTGVECRGEEHEVVLVWSLSSGKRLVLADDKEVHFSQGGKITDTRFETSWTMAGGHIVKVIANAAPAVFGDPTYRQFDLLLDGCSFFDMPRVYQLGMTRGPASHVNANKYAFAAPSRMSAYEHSETYGGRGVSDYSLPETPPPRVAAQPSRSIESMPANIPSRASESTPPADIVSQPVSQPDLFDSSPVAPCGAPDEFTPKLAPPPTPPTFEIVSNQIMSAYGPPPAAAPVLALTNAPHDFSLPPQQQQPYQQAYHQQPAATNAFAYSNYTAVSPESYYQQQQYQAAAPEASPYSYGDLSPYSQAPPAFPATPDSSSSASGSSSSLLTPTMEPLSIEEMEIREQPPMSAMEQALKNLVHLDDMTESKETPEQIRARQVKAKNEPARSKPLPPAKPDWSLGLNATLGDIKQRAPAKTPSKEVMRVHAFDPNAVHAGMMVVYGDTSIPQPQGFGAGVHVASHYYHQQQAVGGMYGAPQAHYGYPQQQLYAN